MAGFHFRRIWFHLLPTCPYAGHCWNQSRRWLVHHLHVHPSHAPFAFTPCLRSTYDAVIPQLTQLHEFFRGLLEGRPPSLAAFFFYIHRGPGIIHINRTYRHVAGKQHPFVGPRPHLRRSVHPRSFSSFSVTRPLIEP
jgi:hypothetical protein